jgi:hypothetical protein
MNQKPRLTRCEGQIEVYRKSSSFKGKEEFRLGRIKALISSYVGQEVKNTRR